MSLKNAEARCEALGGFLALSEDGFEAIFSEDLCDDMSVFATSVAGWWDTTRNWSSKDSNEIS